MKTLIQQHYYQSQKGFTLLETLISLFIMGVATATILTLIGQNTRYTIYAEEQALASIVADNVIVETLANPSVLERGLIQGEETMGGRQFVFDREIDESSIAGIITISVRVRKENTEQVLAEITTLKTEQL